MGQIAPSLHIAAILLSGVLNKNPPDFDSPEQFDKWRRFKIKQAIETTDMLIKTWERNAIERGYE